MSRNLGVFDLGDADTADRPESGSVLDAAPRDGHGSTAHGRPAVAPVTRPRPRHILSDRVSRFRAWPGLTRTLSLFVPGAGQLVRGETTLGLFLLTSTLFLLSLAWAVLDTLDRLAGTLELLGVSVMVVFGALGAFYAIAALIHLTAVLTSIDETGPGDRIDYHPALTGAASALLPGWGQLLNGDRVRTIVFLACVWIAGAVWITISPATTELLNAYLPGVSPWEQAVRRPGVLWAAQYTFPVVVWALAVYDAWVSAAGRR
jgi:hypothetical protein